jgi:hypothetical protein
LATFHSSKAQTSVLTSGGDFSSNYGSMSYSIGEVFNISKGTGFKLQEGAQQCFIINPIYTHSNLHLSIFPNPTTDFIYFKVENFNYLNLSYILFDLTGKTILKGKIIDIKSFISLKNLPSQSYLLKCFRGNEEENTFKIQKIN